MPARKSSHAAPRLPSAGREWPEPKRIAVKCTAHANGCSPALPSGSSQSANHPEQDARRCVRRRSKIGWREATLVPVAKHELEAPPEAVIRSCRTLGPSNRLDAGQDIVAPRVLAAIRRNIGKWNQAVSWKRSAASGRMMARVACNLSDVSRAIQTVPREAARRRRACGIRTR